MRLLRFHNHHVTGVDRYRSVALRKLSGTDDLNVAKVRRKSFDPDDSWTGATFEVCVDASRRTRVADRADDLPGSDAIVFLHANASLFQMADDGEFARPVIDENVVAVTRHRVLFW